MEHSVLHFQMDPVGVLQPMPRLTDITRPRQGNDVKFCSSQSLTCQWFVNDPLDQLPAVSKVPRRTLRAEASRIRPRVTQRVGPQVMIMSWYSPDSYVCHFWFQWNLKHPQFEDQPMQRFELQVQVKWPTLGAGVLQFMLESFRHCRTKKIQKKPLPSSNLAVNSKVVAECRRAEFSDSRGCWINKLLLSLDKKWEGSRQLHLNSSALHVILTYIDEKIQTNPSHHQ